MDTSASVYHPPDLKNRVALVAGATRGLGRGIALALGEAGATVYCTGRSTAANRIPRNPNEKISPHDHARRPETIDQTAAMVTARGGKGIAVVANNNDSTQVKNLIQKIRDEQGGKLHILVNDISELVHTDFGKLFWQLNLEQGLKNLQNVVQTHVTTSHFSTPLLIETAAAEKRTSLIVEIGDGDSYSYRGHLFYDLTKTTVIRLAFAMARELRRKNVAAVALTPGFLRSEAMLEHFGVTKENWRDAGKQDPNYLASETPLFAGRSVAALYADPDLLKKSGRVWSSWRLSDEYPFTDEDGSRPHWGRHFAVSYGNSLKYCDDAFYNSWTDPAVDALFPDWP
jgi:NAD(P)-dependent dehydrogenase (short-subunit alcohol dehydrogenase family)